jgi:hypothetical protein
VHTEPALPVWDTSEERIGPTLGCVNSSRIRVSLASSELPGWAVF